MPPLYSVCFLVTGFLLISPANCGKCGKTIPERGIYSHVKFPVAIVKKVIQVPTARNLFPSEDYRLERTQVNGRISVPSSLELLQLECSAAYRVQWGFESFPWITYNTWTTAVRPQLQNESFIYTATIEFYKVQETSLQQRIPICHSVKDPCIQTAVVPRSAPPNMVELRIAEGSHYAIQSKSEKEQFGSNQNCSLKFGYDPESQKFYCRETDPKKSNLVGKIFLRACQDPVTCGSLLTHSSCNLQPDFPISECSAVNRCRNETSYAGKFPGIAVCHSGNAPEHCAAIPYFYALTPYNSSTNRTKRYLNWNDASPEEMLNLEKFDVPVYTSQKLSLTCNASYYYLGSGMYFDLIREDTPGSDSDDVSNDVKQIYNDLQYEKWELASASETIVYDDANIGGIGSRLPLIRSLEVKNMIFDAPGTYEVSCSAPVWNGSQWAKESTKIVVRESVLPIFDGGNKTVTQYYAPYKRLECIAFGKPKPDLSWTRDGGTIPNEISLTTGEQNGTFVWAVLTFPKLEYGVQGKFTCTASNVAGSVTKSIIIIPVDNRSTTAVWILVGLAVLIAVLIPLILFLSWKVRSQKKHIEDLTQEEVDEFMNGRPDYIPFQCDMSTYAYYLPYDVKYEISRESLEIDFNKILGSGEYGLVVYGLYKNSNPPDGSAPLVQPVAVKTTKPLTNGKEYFKALLSELKIMTYIGNHENIVNLIGACTANIKKREVYIASEFCENGSLLAFLRMNRYTYDNSLNYAELAHSRLSAASSLAETSFISSSGCGGIPLKDVQYVKMEDLGNIALSHQYENIRSIKIKDLLQWSYEVARGMEFLTSKKVIHGDLAARNVLLTREFTAKIGDFGLSRQLYHYNYYTKTAVTPLPLKWLAIESLQSFQFSVESDVWAYGITLYEIFSIGEIPYSSIQMNGEEFLRALKQGMRLSKPLHASPEIFELMMRCWRHDKKQRPNFTEITNFFQPKVLANNKQISSSQTEIVQLPTHYEGDPD